MRECASHKFPCTHILFYILPLLSGSFTIPGNLTFKSSDTIKSLCSAGGLLSPRCISINLRSPSNNAAGGLAGKKKSSTLTPPWFQPKCSTPRGWKLPYFQEKRDTHTRTAMQSWNIKTYTASILPLKCIPWSPPTGRLSANVGVKR